MFYTHVILSRRGPLSRVWLAAHWDKKLTKANILEIDIDSSIEEILKPKVRLSLRTSGHLLLGVTRIHSRKIKYLFSDCNEAVNKIKMAFRSGTVEHDGAGRKDLTDTLITLPEVYEFDSILPEIEDFNLESLPFTSNQCAPESITLKENCDVPPLRAKNGTGDGFGSGDVSSIYSFIFNTVEESIGVVMKDSMSQNEDNQSQNSGEFNRIMEKTAYVNNSGSFIPSFRVPSLQDNTIVGESLSGKPLINSFALEPLNVQQITLARSKKRKKLLVDEVKGISSELMKQQMEHAGSLVHVFERAPPSKRLRVQKAADASDRFFTTWASLGRVSIASAIEDMLNKNLTYNSSRQNDFDLQEDEPSVEMTRFQHSNGGGMALFDGGSSVSKRLCELGHVETMMSSVPQVGPLSDPMMELTSPGNFGLDVTCDRIDFDGEDLVETSPFNNLKSGIENFSWKVRDMIKQIESELTKGDGEIYFDGLVAGDCRKTVAFKFYSLLVLKKHSVIDVFQEDMCFGAIGIRAGTVKVN